MRWTRKAANGWKDITKRTGYELDLLTRQFIGSLFTLPSAAHDQQVHLAMVRRQPRRVDNLHVVFPIGSVWRLQLCACADAAQTLHSGFLSCRPAPARSLASSHRAQFIPQARGFGQSIMAYPYAVARNGGTALLRPLRDQSAGASLVFPSLSEQHALALICPV